MKNYFAMSFLAVCATVTLASAAITGNSADFTKKAYQDGMTEVRLGRQAQQQSTNAEIQAYGRMLEKDHLQADIKLRATAMVNDMTLPMELTSEQQSTLDKLAGLRGADFDRQFLQVAIQAHQKAITAFKTQAQSGSNANLRSFASKTEPTLEDHLKMAQTLQSKLP